MLQKPKKKIDILDELRLFIGKKGLFTKKKIVSHTRFGDGSTSFTLNYCGQLFNDKTRYCLRFGGVGFKSFRGSHTKFGFFKFFFSSSVFTITFYY
jgi:hypothetical protein